MTTAKLAAAKAGRIWRSAAASALLHLLSGPLWPTPCQGAPLGLSGSLSWASVATDGHTAREAEIDHLLASMTPAQKMAQLLMVGFAGTEMSPFLRTWVGERGIGGVALFGRNLKHPEQIKALTHGLAALRLGRVGPFIAVDQEGGSVLRIRTGLSVLPGNMVLGAADDTVLAYLAGRATASDLLRLGFNMNFAPVLDINSNPENPVINVRSFGERPNKVAQLGVAYLRGQQAAGVFAVAKHFPGHGDTNADSHFAMPQVQASRQRLNRVELLPFRAAAKAQVDGVMTAHIALPLLPHAGNVPATLSPVILGGLLREQLGYDGVVITDDLEMQGIAQRYGLGGAVVAAILAGADMPMVLWGEEGLSTALAAIATAVQRGDISKDRLDASVRRILRAKARRGLLGTDDSLHLEGGSTVPNQLPVERGPDGELARLQLSPGENPWHAQLMERIAEAGITVVSNDGKAWPLPSRQGMLVVAPAGPFLTAMAAGQGVKSITLPNLPTAQQRHQVSLHMQRALNAASRVVVAVANRYHVDMVAGALHSNVAVPSIVVSLASPYWRRDFPSSATYLCAYSGLPSAQRAAARVLLEEAPAQGHLPVSVDAQHPVGTGLTNRPVPMPH